MSRHSRNRAAGTARHETGSWNGANLNSQIHSTLCPAVLQIWKRNKWCVVAKVVKFDGRPVLATVVRHQQGTKDVVSMPIVAVDYADDCDAEWWYLRHDRKMRMWRIRLEDLRKRGWWRDGELYVKLSDMEAVPWQEWAYIEKTVKLGRQQELPSESELEQLTMFTGGRP